MYLFVLTCSTPDGENPLDLTGVPSFPPLPRLPSLPPSCWAPSNRITLLVDLSNLFEFFFLFDIVTKPKVA